MDRGDFLFRGTNINARDNINIYIYARVCVPKREKFVRSIAGGKITNVYASYELRSRMTMISKQFRRLERCLSRTTRLDGGRL